MSYILQALKKAEAERGLGRVPGLDAPLVMPPRAERGANPFNRLNPAWRWVALGAALAVTAVALAAWSLGRFASTPAAAPLVTLTPTPSPSPAQPQTVAAVTPTPTAVQASAPMAPSVVTPAPPSLPRLAPPRANAAAPVRAAPPPSAAASAATPQPWPATPGWPTLTLGGSVYSELPTQRMLVINGQVLREGDAASAELTLLHIGATSAIWRYKGGTYLWRY